MARPQCRLLQPGVLNQASQNRPYDTVREDFSLVVNNYFYDPLAVNVAGHSRALAAGKCAAILATSVAETEANPGRGACWIIGSETIIEHVAQIAFR